MSEASFTAMFPFCGLGAGARGFLDAQVTVLGRTARFESLGGIDVDAAACEDFRMLTGSPCLQADIATLTVEQLLRFCPRSPDVVFMSPPCKGFSGLLGAKKAQAPKYQALNRLVLDWIELMLQAWRGRLPGLVLLENVPRIASRGSTLLRRVRKLLRAAGYVFHSQTHDCGELGGLAQRRRRFLLVARLPSRISPLLYQPPPKRVRGCGEVLQELPLPNDPVAGPMHVMPKISWLNWVRLALIPAGGDWRDLPGVLDELQARREVHKRHAVEPWDAPTGAVAGSGSNGVANVADPRLGDAAHNNLYNVRAWDQAAKTVTGSTRPGSGAPSVADPRLGWFPSAYGVTPWEAGAGTVTGQSRPSNGRFSIADPRLGRAYDHGYRVLGWTEPSFTVHGKAHPGTGAYSVADVRVPSSPRGGAYGVLSWEEAAKTVTGSASVDNGAWAVADPRRPADPPVMVIEDIRKAPPGVPLIVAQDGTWHRPLTSLELAALQGIPTVVDGRPLQLSGRSSTAWRERIGNAVPPPTARAIAEQMLVALVEELEGTMLLRGDGSVWVRPEALEAR